MIVNYTLSTESDVKGEIIDAVQDLVQGTETVSIDGKATPAKSAVIESGTSEGNAIFFDNGLVSLHKVLSRILDLLRGSQRLCINMFL